MTCIVGLVEGERAWLGGDAVAVDEAWNIAEVVQPKVFRVGEMLLGYAGDFRYGQLLQTAIRAVPPEPTDDAWRWLVGTYVEVVRESLRGYGALHVSNEVQMSKWGVAVVAMRGHLYTLQPDLAVLEYRTPYVALGLGAHYALGALYATDRSVCAQVGPSGAQRVQIALEAAARHSAGVRGPYTILEASPQNGTAQQKEAAKDVHAEQEA